MNDQLGLLLFAVFLIFILRLITRHYKINLSKILSDNPILKKIPNYSVFRNILTYSIIVYVGLCLIVAVCFLPIALLFNDTEANPLYIIFMLPISTGIFILPYFVPILIVITLIMMTKEGLKNKNNKILLSGIFLLIPVIIFFSNYFYGGEGKFVATGNMITPRTGHAAVLLNDGKVLISGGYTGGAEKEYSNSAEIYDPKTSRFYLTGNMNYARAYHTEILLKNGKVLILGGNKDIPNAELYDPNTGKFSLTGNMLFFKEYHTSTLLKDGRVFILADVIKNNKNKTPDTSSVAEIYNPETGKFSYIGKTFLFHGNHETTLLPNGKVLITGGNTIQNAELYDPNTGKFRLTGKPEHLFRHFTATLLDDNRVLLAENNNADLYDINKGVFTSSKNSIRGKHCGVGYCTAIPLKNKKVLLLPIYRKDEQEDPVKSIMLDKYGYKQELYDPVKDTFVDTKRIWLNISQRTTTLLNNGDVLITGGEKIKPLNQAVLYKY